MRTHHFFSFFIRASIKFIERDNTKLVPNTPANIYTLSAIVIGYILLNNSTPAEQNSLGNWFMLIGQALCTNSAQQQVINNRNGTSNKSNQHIINDTFDSDYTVENIEKVIKVTRREIDNIKKGI